MRPDGAVRAVLAKRKLRWAMRKHTVLCAVMVACGAASSADYLMEGGDNGRTGWLRNDKSFDVNNVRNMKLLWKTKLDSVPREMHNLFPPLIATGVNTAGGKKEILIVAGFSDDIFAVDAVTGSQLWRKHFDNTWAPGVNARRGDTLCPGGQTAVPVIGNAGSGKYTVYAVSWDGRLWKLKGAGGAEVSHATKVIPRR